MLIVVPDDNPPAMAGTPALERLRRSGEVLVYDSDATEPGVLADRLRDADVAVNIRGRTRFTDEVLRVCPKLRLISIWGTGTDNVDLKAAAARGITVTNTPGANAIAVAEHTVALMLGVVKQLAQADQAMRQGGWPRNLVCSSAASASASSAPASSVARSPPCVRGWAWRSWPGPTTRIRLWPRPSG